MKISHHPRAVVFDLRHIQRIQPGPPARLHDDAVVQRIALALPLRWLRQLRSEGLGPALAVETLEGDRAPVQAIALRNRSLEAGPKGQRARSAQLGDIARRHAVGQTRYGPLPRLRKRPQRAESRKQ